jgi:hypothetical protein
MEALGSLTLGMLLFLPAIWLMKNQRRFEAAWRAWLARHPGVMLTSQIIVATIAVLILGLVAVIVLPLLPLWVFAVVAFWGFLHDRDRRHREVLAAIRKR